MQGQLVWRSVLGGREPEHESDHELDNEAGDEANRETAVVGPDFDSESGRNAERDPDCEPSRKSAGQSPYESVA